MYNRGARCIADGCRHNALSEYQGTCGMPGCIKKAQKYNPTLVQNFIEALIIDPKSAAAKDFYKSIKQDWESVEKVKALQSKKNAAIIISEQKRQRQAELAAALNDQTVLFNVHLVKHFFFSCFLNMFLSCFFFTLFPLRSYYLCSLLTP